MLKNLRKIRIERNVTQEKLGNAIDVSQQSINKYENHGIEPDIRTMTAIADYFDISVDYLIGRTEISHVYEHLTPHDLNEDESALIAHYRQLAPAEKDSIKFVINNYLVKKK